jgi:8-oxo-dGTP diphosphatase
LTADGHEGTVTEDVVRLIRHAKAGSRYDYVGDDRERPLSKKGRAQAEAIADRLAPLGPSRLVSSPFLRCRQTLEPLAARCALQVVADVRFAEGVGYHVALEQLQAMPTGAVVCSHGDVIPAVIDALLRRGAELTADPDPRKGVTWELHRVDAEFVRVHVVPPPAG